jgi:hypothetical protein
MPKPDPRSVYGDQPTPERDNPLGSYGYSRQKTLGVTEDRVGMVRKAIETSTEHRHEIERAKETRFGANRSEVIDPRGVSDSK